MGSSKNVRNVLLGWTNHRGRQKIEVAKMKEVNPPVEVLRKNPPLHLLLVQLGQGGTIDTKYFSLAHTLHKRIKIVCKKK